jgi:single-strand DNA-binding protein
MNDTITIRGIVATEPRNLVTQAGFEITSLRLASPSRRWDRTTSSWTNGETNWFTVTAFRSLAKNVKKSVNKGDRVIVCGRLRVRNWERSDRSGTSVDIDADTVGHDLAWGQATWMKLPRGTADDSAGPGETPTETERAAAQQVVADTASAPVDPAVDAIELPSAFADMERDAVDSGGGPLLGATALSPSLTGDDDASTPF